MEIDIESFKGYTKGVWYAVQHARGSKAWRVTLSPDDARGDICNVISCLGNDHGTEGPVARLIAAAPSLLAEVIRLRAEIEQLTPAIASRGKSEGEG